MKRSLSGWILSCILSTATLASAQIATTSLRGTIKDPTGAVVPGARVTLLDKATGKMLSAVAGNTGFYDLEQIPPATYTITVSAGGFGDQSKIAELLVDQPATIDFTLRVQSSTVTVDVSAEAQTLNTTDASLGGSADTALIQALPSETRNVPDLLSLQPGVLYYTPPGGVANNDSRQGAVNGGRSDQGNVTIDGIDDNDQVNGYAFQGVLRETQDSIEEFRVTTGQADSDAGRSSGAQVSMLTKSGTNKFHGAAYWYYRPPLTAANNWFQKQAELEEGLPNIPTKVLRNIFGADTGGPIKKDKLFFFANYEGQRLAENAEVIQTVPTASYDAGIITYPGGSVSAAQVTALDAACQVCKTSQYPLPPGPNPNALAYLKSMPVANGTLQGDGLNEGSFAFSSPNPQNENTSIVRLDYTPNDRHRIFARGNLQKDDTAYPEQFPGQGPYQVYEDNSKGMTFGDTWSIKPNLINDLRYGYIRQGNSTRGVGQGDYVDFRFLSTPTAETRSSINNVPVNNIIDNLSWTKGKHTLEFGANWRLIHQNNDQDNTTWQNASTNPYWMTGLSPGSSAAGSGFTNSYDIAYDNLLGAVPSLTNSYNYKVTSATTGSLLPDGAFLKRSFSANEYEWFVQDQWHATQKLVITLGLRHSILQTPWETSGQEVAPTFNTNAFALQRESEAQGGQIYEPNMLFAPTGKYYGKPGFWPKTKDNFAPRVAIAYSPDSKTSLRVGAGLYYDHFGEALVSTFDQHGEFGTSSSITNAPDVYSIEGSSAHPGSPRFLGRSILPPINNGGSPAIQKYPFAPPIDGFEISWGLDNNLKTPYSETFDASVQRTIPGGFTVEAAYVGRLGRHLLQSWDVAEPVDYVDPSGGGDYYAAGTKLSRDVDSNNGKYGYTPSSPHVTAIPYFEDVFSFMKGFDYAGESATQAVYNNEWAPNRSQNGATTGLSDLDFYGPLYGFYPAPANWQPHFWQNQFSSLYALASIGMSYYNAGELTLRHPTSHGLVLEVSYTYSSSIDMGSDAERAGGWQSSSFSDILNTWKPYLNRGHSDFNTTHLLTTDWVYALPFGRGKAVAGSANPIVDAFIGGWQFSGINRLSSGLPMTQAFYEPGWTTNWQIESNAVKVGPVPLHRHFDSEGNPQFFANADAINNSISCGGQVCPGYTGPAGGIRLPYPGEAGERNSFNGDGYFDIDSGLSKTWKFGEWGGLKFSWEVYNVTNTVRFDPASIGGGLTGGNLGIASGLLTSPRRMQFALRYDF
ncbi:MAG: TonB-dependent receptor [Terracidiphilus sp.]